MLSLQKPSLQKPSLQKPSFEIVFDLSAVSKALFVVSCMNFMPTNFSRGELLYNVPDKPNMRKILRRLDQNRKFTVITVISSGNY
jgi:hypothetical protein